MKAFVNVFRREPPRCVASDDVSPLNPPEDPSTPAHRFSSWIKLKQAKPSKPLILPQVTIAPEPSLPPPTDDDDDSDPYDEQQDDLPLRPTPVSSSHRASSHSPARNTPMPALRSHINMRAITLAPRPPCPPPFVHAPSGPLFPRSINSAHSLPVLQTVRIAHHKAVLVKRLENRSLTPAESESIAAFGARRPKHHHHPSTAAARRPKQGLEDEDVSDLLKKNEKRVGDVSHGVRRWIKRPCFEQRCVSWVWHPEQAKYLCHPILGSDKAVAALEFSVGLEAMAGMGVMPDTPPETSRGTLPPLRIAPLSLPDLVSSTSSSSTTPNMSPSPLTPTSPNLTPTAHRKLHHLSASRHPSDDDDEEDNVPLGYHVLNRREQEERDRKEREEERRKKIYAAEVVAARSRRENARAGIIEKEPASHSRAHYSRPAYDPSMRRLASEPDTRQGLLPSSSSSPQRLASEPGPDGKARRPLSSRSISDDTQQIKKQRRTSAVSESGSVSGRSSHRYSLGGPHTLPLMPPLPPLPPVPPVPMVPVVPMMPMSMPIPVFVPTSYMVPTPTPQPQPGTPTGSITTSMMPALVPPPPLRPNLPVSRSAERLPMVAKSESGGRRQSAYRRATMQVTPSSVAGNNNNSGGGGHTDGSRRRESNAMLKASGESRRTSMQVSSPLSPHRSTALVHSSTTHLHPHRMAR